MPASGTGRPMPTKSSSLVSAVSANHSGTLVPLRTHAGAASARALRLPPSHVSRRTSRMVKFRGARCEGSMFSVCATPAASVPTARAVPSTTAPAALATPPPLPPRIRPAVAEPPVLVTAGLALSNSVTLDAGCRTPRAMLTIEGRAMTACEGPKPSISTLMYVSDCVGVAWLRSSSPAASRRLSSTVLAAVPQRTSTVKATGSRFSTTSGAHSTAVAGVPHRRSSARGLLKDAWPKGGGSADESSVTDSICTTSSSASLPLPASPSAAASGPRRQLCRWRTGDIPCSPRPRIRASSVVVCSSTPVSSQRMSFATSEDVAVSTTNRTPGCGAADLTPSTSTLADGSGVRMARAALEVERSLLSMRLAPRASDWPESCASPPCDASSGSHRTSCRSTNGTRHASWWPHGASAPAASVGRK
mmetsp:Transcript_7966/g.24466  ORF Transcript_7966/g.24466 Transcript_7966/m.24466 type:complete len:419 (+) Transcript_7966:3332-4588(+)